MKHSCVKYYSIICKKPFYIFLLNFEIIVASHLLLHLSLISKKVNCYDKYVQNKVLIQTFVRKFLNKVLFSELENARFLCKIDDFHENARALHDHFPMV